jgi:hypothetical protein
VTPSAEPQTALTVSGACEFSWMIYGASVDMIDRYVIEARGVAGSVVK